MINNEVSQTFQKSKHDKFFSGRLNNDIQSYVLKSNDKYYSLHSQHVNRELEIKCLIMYFLKLGHQKQKYSYSFTHINPLLHNNLWKLEYETENKTKYSFYIVTGENKN